MIELTLPYPPSVNSYWRRVGNKTLISRGGRLFRDEVTLLCRTQKRQTLAGRLRVAITLHPPDRRRRDIDNVAKALLDAMQHGGVYEDDSQIDVLTIQRLDCMPGGKTVVTITEV